MSVSPAVLRHAAIGLVVLAGLALLAAALVIRLRARRAARAEWRRIMGAR